MFATDNAQLPSVQMCPDKWLGPHRTHGLRLWNETTVSEGVLGLYTAPKRKKKKWQVYNSNWEWREFNTSHQAAALLLLLGKIRQEEKPRFGGLLRHS